MLRIINNYSLKQHNTFGLEVNAREFVVYEREEDVVELIGRGVIGFGNYIHIGEGSNLLFVGEEVVRVVKSKINFIEKMGEEDGRVLLRVGSGVVWDYLCEVVASMELWGIENLSGIPGEVGAAAVQNIGAYGVEVGDVIKRVETVDVRTAERRVFEVDDCDYGYRSSIFKSGERGCYIITAVEIELRKEGMADLRYSGLREEFGDEESPSVRSVREKIISIREGKLPSVEEYGSAGSFFKNPTVGMETYNSLIESYPSMPYFKLEDGSYKIPAAWLIDQSGMKDYQLGGAAVYENQPLVIINKNNASGGELYELSKLVQKKVEEKFDIYLETEVEIIR